jgi:DNA-directed RNA polymerase specialized sigma24 family protein
VWRRFAPEASAEIERTEESALLERVVAQLDADERWLFAQRQARRSLAEIAAELKVSIKRVRVRERRLYKRLRALAKRRGGGLTRFEWRQRTATEKAEGEKAEGTRHKANGTR